MSNLKYPIFKLPEYYIREFEKRELPRYIKWWLYQSYLRKHTQKLSDILTGSNFTLENTVARKFNIFEVQGNTEQEQLTGIQLFNKNGTEGYNNYATLTVLDTGVKATSSESGRGSSYVSIKIPNAESLLGQTLTLYAKATPNTNRTSRMAIAFINSSGVYVSQIARIDFSGTGTVTNVANFTVASEFPTNATGIAILFYGNITSTTQGEYVDYTEVRLYKGTYSPSKIPDYEPYCGRYSSTKSTAINVLLKMLQVI